MAEHSLADNAMLRVVAERFGAEAVMAASMSVLGFPATLVGTHVEASQILNWLESQTLNQ